MITDENSRWSDLFSGKNAASAIALSLGVALHAINILVATTILPSVVQDIGGLDLYAWNTTLFVVASILGSALSARLLSGYGARSAYLVASLFFIVGAMLCALAPSMPVMLIGRTVQGFGGGLIFALSYAMINLVFEQKLWPRAMALISAMWGIATLVGPAVGGIFAELNAWRWAFGILLPIMVLYAAFTFRILPKGKPQQRPTPLPLMQLLLLAGAVLVVSAGSLAESGWLNVGGIVLALLLLIGLIRREGHSRARLLPHQALRRGSALASLYVTVTLLVIGMTSEIFVPYFLQTLHGQSPLISGYIAATMAAGWTLSEILSSGWRGVGIRLAIISGPILVLLGLLGLAVLMPIPSNGHWQALGPIVLALTLVGFGIGFGWPHLLTRILQVAPQADKDIAGASITTVQLFATAFGAALAGMVTNLAGFTAPGGIEGASSAAHWLFLLFALAPLLAIYSAWRSAAISQPAEDPSNFVQTPGSGEC
ncbi:MFS transporter [Serratia sp. JSRIV001]|uniref:MFS transporter n=1 Tax=Serratia sp. JSRIV001 TaxID=2831893 RepID=UPI001CBC91C4|nr:MFS transporter [Serratia sp. JSRIV001]UAN47511.1 MFS transporter [Serratia sp. JSRIV001]